MASLGDILFRDSSVWKRLAGNITTTRKFLSQTGNGAVSAAPGWNQVDVADLSGLGTGVATFLGTPSSTNLRGALTDETGLGAAVFADGPTLIAPILGTPASGNLANCTAYPISAITGLGTGVGTFLATPSIGNLNTALTGGKLPYIVRGNGAASSTSSLTEVNLGVANIPILGANDRLEIFALYTFTGVAAAKTPVIRHNTSSAATSGGTSLLIAATAANILSARYVYEIQNANSVSTQVANFGVGFGTSTTTNTAGSINTGNASFINFNGFVGNGADACILVSFSVMVYPGV